MDLHGKLAWQGIVLCLDWDKAGLGIRLRIEVIFA